MNRYIRGVGKADVATNVSDVNRMLFCELGEPLRLPPESC